MKSRVFPKCLTGAIAAAIGLACLSPVAAQSISGSIFNSSAWEDSIAGPPGDGNGAGQLRVALFPELASLYGAQLAATNVIGGGLPFAYGPYGYSLGTGLSNGNYVVLAWVDGNVNGFYDIGEPFGKMVAAVSNAVDVTGIDISLTDDSNLNNLPDWWEYHWFRFSPDPFGQTATADPDGDGLSNEDEARIASIVPGLSTLAPNNWDTDGDGMDDKWEYEHYLTIPPGTNYIGLSPCTGNKTNDFDGDGLSDWQEYCGVDRIPRMQLDKVAGGVTKGKLNPQPADDLNPLDVDTDYDLLIDSFEAAWHDPAAGIDPYSGVARSIPTTTNVNSSIARADPDQDGLSNYREQCLLTNLWQASANGHIWDWGDRVPFPYNIAYKEDGAQVRVCTLDSAPLKLGLVMSEPFATTTNRAQLRRHGWTDPTDGTGYYYTDEDIPPGHDTDGDWLPDGWEVQFNLDPRDDGMTTWTGGPFGDPDDDGLFNIDEFLGQDGDRSTTRPYINGTRDETNPNEYNHRPDSTYEWRWRPANPLLSLLTDPRVGTGISRAETLGSALPTTSVGVDEGGDTDDDGIRDDVELYPTNELVAVSSPVYSCDPFLPRSVLIAGSNGIPIPDPERAIADGPSPAGAREDLQRRDWTLECQVKLLGTNLTGELFDFQTLAGTRPVMIYRLSLSNNIPILVSTDAHGQLQSIRANALPTNRWVHLAGVWNHADNSLGLYVGGVLFNAKLNVGESFSSLFMFPATNRLALATATNGSFAGKLMLDEVRIWGVARSAELIAEFSRKLIPLGNGDDVWVDTESSQYYGRADSVIVNGGSLFEGEPGVLLSNVCQSVDQANNYWIDDGDHQYTAARDVLLQGDASLAEGLPGSLVTTIRWNDKDGDGVFSRDSLLAYFRFDDGGMAAEDFARRAKNGLTGATAEDCLYGDGGYALTNGGSFMWVTNDSAPVLGVDKRGADDSDHDGLPDAWEMTHRLDAWDDGSHGESYAGAKDGPNGAAGDPDRDGLINLYEYWAGANPHDDDSDGNWTLDSQEDRDGDGVLNITEQQLGSRPDMVDTDDDGLADNEEQGLGSSPADPSDPSKSRALVFGGSPNDYLEVPSGIKQRLTDMTLEAWVKPTNSAAGAGIIIRRTIENLSGGGYAVNYVMGLETNAGGGLRLYAGYVMPDGSPTGRPYIVRGSSPMPTGAWTHVAASYSSLGAILSLYTNGALCASNNTCYEAPRVNGKGGETFVRIGEDLAGGIDEVRVWNKVRTPAEIRAGMTNVISGGSLDGLVHSFRFDDGEATTNGPFTNWNDFHQPGGFQDYTYLRDWNEQWRHAAVRHGAISLTNSPIASPPSLRVILAPDAAKAAGAQWQFDGGAWQNGGDSLQGLTPGPHSVSFKSIVGWTEPAMVSLTLSNDIAVTLTYSYIQKATLSVTLGPQEALDAAMQWRVDKGAWQSSGAVVSELKAGLHSLSYTPLPGFLDPIVKSVDLSPGEARSIPVQYSRIEGAISVVLLPGAAAASGAQWQLGGGALQNSGVVLSSLPLADYTIDFTSLSGWETPPSVIVSLTNQGTVTVTGKYVRVTGLEVQILPAEVLALGAQWRLTGGDWTNSGAFLRLPAGGYTIQFKSVDNNWLTPGDQVAVVVSQQLTSVIGTYLRADIFGGAVGQEPGQFNTPRGLALDFRHRLYVADTFNDRIQMFDPYDRSWTNWGQYGTNLGQFNKPGGVAVDGQGNIYVADSNNNRVQKRTATNGQWKAWGAYGTNIGQFIVPTDVGIDSRTNLFVADLFNNRVQKMNATGTWSVAISNGVLNGRVTAPKGILVDALDNLYVSDDGTQTNGQSRIQKFSSNGQFQAPILGGALPSEGGLKYPGGMAIGEASLYVADINNSRVAWSAMTNTVWTTLLGSNILSRPEDVVWDPRGILYVADTLHHRILSLPITAGATNGAAQFAGLVSAGTGTTFTIYWFARSNWYYAVQYANDLGETEPWPLLPGGANIPGHDALTNCTDGTVGGVTSRYYRIIAY